MKHLETNQKLSVLASALEIVALLAMTEGSWCLAYPALLLAAIVNVAIIVRVRRARAAALEAVRQRWVTLFQREHEEREARRLQALHKRGATQPPRDTA